MKDLKNRSMSSLANIKHFPTLTKDMSRTKLFKDKDTLIEAKKQFAKRIQAPPSNEKNQQQTLRKQTKRSLIHLPKMRTVQGFVSFEQINRSETKLILDNFSKMRSHSTHLQPLLKAQMMYNSSQIQQINKMNDERLLQERMMGRKRLMQRSPVETRKSVKLMDRQRGKNNPKQPAKIFLTLNQKVYTDNLEAWKPFIDYDAIPVPINGEVYFFGGRKVCPAVYKLAKNRWGELGEVSGLKPFGNSVVCAYDNDQLLSFGGYDYLRQGFSLISNALRIINVRTLKCQIVSICPKKVPPRAFHHQCLYDKYLIVSGGQDSNHKLLNTVMSYHFEKKYWNQIQFSHIPSELLCGFAKHQSVPVFHGRKEYGLYSDEPISQRDNHIKQEGIYLFGGEDGNGNLISRVFVMTLGKPSLSITALNTSGKGPLASKYCQVSRSNKYLIVHGGRNDEINPFVLNSMHFLNLLSFEWVQVHGDSPPYRYGHAMTAIGSEIVILGGKNISGLCKQVHLMTYYEQKEQ